MVFSEPCALPNGATPAIAMLKGIFFMISLSCLCCDGNKPPVFRFILAGEELAAIFNSHARCRTDVLTSLFTTLAEIPRSANLGLSGSHEILDRHVRFSVHRVEREFLSRRFGGEEAAAMLRSATFNDGAQLHVPSH